MVPLLPSVPEVFKKSLLTTTAEETETTEPVLLITWEKREFCETNNTTSHRTIILFTKELIFPDTGSVICFPLIIKTFINQLFSVLRFAFCVVFTSYSYYLLPTNFLSPLSLSPLYFFPFTSIRVISKTSAVFGGITLGRPAVP